MMSASIALFDLTWSAPDQLPLFSQLNLSFGLTRTGLIGRNGVGKTTLLRLIAGELRPQSGAVAVQGRLGFQRQTVQVDPVKSVADLFEVTSALKILKRVESGEATDEDLADADWTLEARMASALSRIGLDIAPETLLANLSGGQRTRAGLAALIFTEPDFLLLDEPTNNLDREGRDAVIDLLGNWRSGAIVISHDRELLEIMDEIVEITTLGVLRYGENWNTYREIKAQELAAAKHELEDAEKRIADISRSAQIKSERQARANRTGQRKGAKGGTPRIILGGMKDRAEKTSGENDRLAERRRKHALEAAETARERIEILQPLKIQLPSTHLPAGKAVLNVSNATVGYERDRPIIQELSFSIVGPERMAVTGPNGSGKTTLLALITGQLLPWAGIVQVSTNMAMLDQRVSLLDPATSIIDNFKRINPQENENACRASLARFMFRSDAALQMVSTLSGGQLLRAGLACVLGGTTPPPFLILDEPTNHLDIDSIEAVEAGLCAYDGALLIVSHDESFLAAIGINRQLALETAR